MDRIYPL